MRTIKTILICFVIIFFHIQHSNAQIGKLKSVNLSFGPDVSFAQRLLRETHQRGIGGTVKGEYVFAKHTSATISAGYVSFFENKLSNVSAEKLVGIPIKAGLRYYLGQFYVSSEAGIVFNSGFRTGNGFVYSFAVGDEIVTSKRNGNSLDISLRHEGWIRNQQYNFIGLRLAYEFLLN